VAAVPGDISPTPWGKKKIQNKELYVMVQKKTFQPGTGRYKKQRQEYIKN
jgi:hypothetical protein